MEAEQYTLLYRSEDRHWWFVGMRAIADAWLRPVVAERAGPLEILEAGCGTGAMALHLGQWGCVTGIDFSPLALGYSSKRGLERLSRGSVVALPFPANAFDLVTSFDVIYHRAVPDDVQAVREFARVLRPGGYLYLRANAYDWLWGEHDVRVHTARRYTAGDLAARVAAAGLRVRRISYANTLLFPAEVAARVLSRATGMRTRRSEVAVPAAPLNAFLGRVLALEGDWLARRGLPFGGSVLCLAQKAGDGARGTGSGH